jgi:translation elongation factor EF-Tu-like GTPase
MTDGKPHLSVVICGHVDSGKSTTTGRLIFELGGIPARELEKLKEEAAALGKSSFAFAFYMDRQKEERERGVTISCTTKEFFTEKWHYTIIDAPGEADGLTHLVFATYLLVSVAHAVEMSADLPDLEHDSTPAEITAPDPCPCCCCAGHRSSRT